MRAVIRTWYVNSIRPIFLPNIIIGVIWSAKECVYGKLEGHTDARLIYIVSEPIQLEDKKENVFHHETWMYQMKMRWPCWPLHENVNIMLCLYTEDSLGYSTKFHTNNCSGSSCDAKPNNALICKQGKPRSDHSNKVYNICKSGKLSVPKQINWLKAEWRNSTQHGLKFTNETLST